MGVILDSSVLVAAERQGNNARQMLAAVSSQLGETEIALSVITLLELAHGAARADTPERKAKRQQFIEASCSRCLSILLLRQSLCVADILMARIKPKACDYPWVIC
jgi:predicted nucleic acid-binding protein